MDDITLDELDSFHVEMVQRVKIYKMNLDKLLDGTSDDGETMEKTELSPIKNLDLTPVVIEELETTPEAIDQDDDDEFNNDDYLKNRRTAFVRESIHKLLDVTTPLEENNDDPKESPKMENPTTTRLHQRMKMLKEKYNFCDDDDVPAKKPTPILREQNSNAITKPSTFKERLNAIAQSYYPVNQAPEPKKITSVSKNVTRSAAVPVAPKSNNPNEMFKSKSVVQQQDLQNKSPPKFPSVSNQPVVPKKTSVADLKKLFEAKATAESEVKEPAPELLPLREKRRLFEMAIRQENAARAKQYIKLPKAADQCSPTKTTTAAKIIDGTESPDAKRVKIEEPLNVQLPVEPEPVQDSKLAQEPKIPENPENACSEEEHMDESQMESEMLTEEEQQVVPAEPEIEALDSGSMAELTFTALDEEEEQKDFERLTSEENVHRSSTRVDLKTSDSSLPPEKPPRLYVDHQPDEEISEPVNEERQLATDDETVPKTVSFYHREQKMKKDVQLADEYLAQTVSQADCSEINDLCEHFRTMCQEEMVALKGEISEHNRVMSQSSTALKMSCSIPDLKFSDSRIEAERLLLVASEKRVACLNEIARLKTMVHDPETHMRRLENSTKGTLYIKNIKIPFLNEFLVARSNGKVPNKYYFICLVYNGPKVFVSPLLDACKDRTKEALEFDLGLSVKDLDEDFKVLLKIFCLQLITKEKREKESNWTPLKNLGKRLKGTGSIKSSPVAKRPGSDITKVSTMMNTNFRLVGYVPLTLKNVKTTTNKFYRLDSECFRVIIDNYLTMNVAVKASTSVIYPGYFDFRESTFWRSRWFRLQGELLQNWRFENEMEKNEEPLNTINLRHCINDTVALLSPNQRQICARPNTFALITIKPPPVSNAKKLVQGGVITKTNPKIYFISAQAAFDALEFCRHLNRTLRALRVWETDVVQPYSPDEFDRILLHQNFQQDEE